jgi:serine/threonine-protein kinase
MSTDIPHPDRLGPGDRVGPWKILEVLGAGGFGRVFKVENEGKVYALKMSVRLPGERMLGEEDVDGWNMREATAMMGRTPHPNIPRVFSVDRWPEPEAGFLYVVMEFIDGLRFMDWKFETQPTAAQLMDVILPIVRTVADLHKAGIHHRDLNANNIIIRKEDGRPFLLDFGSARLPGARTLTQGLPPVNLSVVPPEAFELLQSQEDDVRFQGGELADLYALGVLLYGALTEGYPFNPQLPPERLVAVISLRVPRAPDRVNPKVPKSLSAITMRLLEKRPEDRFPRAEALYQALWEANKERTSHEWRVSLALPASGPAPISDEEMHERKRAEEVAHRAAELREQAGGAAPAEKDSTEVSNAATEAYAPMSAVAARRTEVIWTWERARRPLRVAVTACALVASLVALAWWSTKRPGSIPEAASLTAAQPVQAGPGGKLAIPLDSPEATAASASPEAAPNPATIAASSAMPSEDSTLVTTFKAVQSKKPSTPIRAVRKLAGAAITCSALAGCPGAPVRSAPPSAPPAEPCPEGAVEAMAKWNIRPGLTLAGTFIPRGARVITVSEGRTTVFLVSDPGFKTPDAELSGRLIFADRVYGRLTEAKVNGRAFPVCFELHDGYERKRGLAREPNGSADTVKVFSSFDVEAVSEFQ